jgi:phosphoribosyl 1,2-cyclic phosphodiesterase
MMKFRLLGSGSSGNATVIQEGDDAFLVDAGLPPRLMMHHLDETLEVPLKALFITHEHVDHVKSLPQVLKAYDIPFYTTLETFMALPILNAYQDRFIPVVPKRPTFIGELTVTAFSTSHDAAHPVGYIFQSDEERLVHFTDLGYIPETDVDFLKNADAYIIESNYDVAMLFDSKRPYHLKQRIHSPKGHLSNQDASFYLMKLLGDQTKTICFTHPSEDCNLDHLIRETFEKTAQHYIVNIDPIKTYIAKAKTLSPWLSIKE